LLPPTDRPRPLVATYRGSNVFFRLGSSSRQKLVDLAQRHGASLFMVLHAGLAALLSRLGAGDDIPIGSPIAGRMDSALDNLVGLFINELVYRADVSGDPTFVQLLARVRETALAAYANQDAPFECVVKAFNPARVSARNPLFQIVLNLLTFPKEDFDLPGLEVTFLPPPPIGVAKFDLTVRFFDYRVGDEAPAGMDGMIEYATDLFDFTTVEILAARLVRLLDAVATDPHQPIGRLDVFTPEERAQLLADGRNPDRHQLIDPAAKQAGALPTPPSAPAGAGRVPQTQREKLLCELFAELLDVSTVGVDDNFFALGGHSMLATRLLARIRTTFDTTLELRTLFDTPTPAGLAAHLRPDAQV